MLSKKSMENHAKVMQKSCKSQASIKIGDENRM